MDEMEKQRFLLLTFQSFLENSPDMIFVKDTRLVYVAASRSFARMTGHDSGRELVGKTDFDLFSPALAEKYTDDDRRVLESGLPASDYIEPLPDQNGRKSFSSTSKFLVRDADGLCVGLYGVSRDVTPQMELEAERERSRMSRQMFDAVLEADLTEDRILRAEGDPSWTGRLDALGDNRFSAAVRLLAERFIHPDCLPEFLERYMADKLSDAYRRGEPESSLITCLRMAGGEERFVECRAHVYHSQVSDTLRAALFFKDADDEVRSRQRLQKKAATDALTGLQNRESVLEHITAALAEEDGGQLNALLFIDLDGFKQVNDTWGHRFGDEVLRQTADQLRQIFRESDVFGRVGGDEFLVFLKRIPSREAVERRAARLLEGLPIRLRQDDVDVTVTCSVGATLCHGGAEGVDKLYEQADRAMYKAKEAGRCRLCFYQDLEGRRPFSENDP